MNYTKVFLMALLVTACASLQAITITYPQGWNYIPTASNGGGLSELGPEDVEALSGTSDQAQALFDLLDGWSYDVTLDTGTLDGTISITDYITYHTVNPSTGLVYESGAGLEFIYTGDDLETDALRFIQVIWYWEEGQGEPTPYLDDEFGVPPFYYSQQEEENAHGDGS